jgi:hypothetical protein
MSRPQPPTIARTHRTLAGVWALPNPGMWVAERITVCHRVADNATLDTRTCENLGRIPSESWRRDGDHSHSLTRSARTAGRLKDGAIEPTERESLW